MTFENANWDVDGKDLHHGRAFGATRFRDVANFETKHPFHAFAAFDGATFERTLLLKDPSTGGAPKARFEDACKAVEAAIAADIASANADKDDKRSRRQVAKEAKANRWDELAGGYRTAKAAMERQGAFERAQRYYRYEVQARIKKPTTTWPERRAAWFYGVFSDYGASIGRPFLGLGGVLVFFTLIYLLIGAYLGEAVVSLTGATEDSWQALEFSLNNAFRPLSALATQQPVEGETVRLAGKLLYGHGGGWGNLVRAFAIFQSLISLVLAFLFGLAVRRKFQIK